MKIILSVIFFAVILLFACKQTDTTTSDHKNKDNEPLPNSKVINILDIGGIGNGKNDNSAIFEKAINQLSGQGGGVLNIPKGHFVITRPILLKDNVTIQGEGETSIIENISKDNILATVIFPGIHHPLKNTEYKYFKTAAPIKTNTDFVTLTSPEHDIKVGDVLFIHSEEHYVGKGARGAKNTKDNGDRQNYKVPDCLIGNKVLSVKGKVIQFENVFKEDIRKPMITKALGVNATHGYKTYSCQNATLRKLKLKTSGKAFRFGLAYKCTFEDLIINAETPIFGNAFQYCTFKNIESTFSNRFIELKNGTHDTKIENCNGKYVPNALLEGKDKNGNVISIGEKAFGVEISKCNINAGDYDLNNTFIFLNANNCKISDNIFSFSGQTIKNFLVLPNKHCDNNQFTNNEINASGVFNNFVKIGLEECVNEADVASNNYIGQNKFFGTPKFNVVHVVCGEDNIIEENYSEQDSFTVPNKKQLKNNKPLKKK